MNRREFLTSTAAVAVSAAVPLPAPQPRARLLRVISHPLQPAPTRAFARVLREPIEAIIDPAVPIRVRLIFAPWPAAAGEPTLEELADLLDDE